MSTQFKPTGNNEADELLLQNHAALLLGMLLDQQIPIERAFLAPYLLKQRLGHFDLKKIAQMPQEKLVSIFCQKPALHRYPADMAKRFHQIAQFITENYEASVDLFLKTSDAEELFSRLKLLPGFSEHKSKIFIALLGKRFAIRPKGWKEVSDPFSKKGAYLSAADVTDEEALKKVRLNKKLLKLSQ
jgi:uncharacterized HhH-GPD family protein